MRENRMSGLMRGRLLVHSWAGTSLLYSKSFAAEVVALIFLDGIPVGATCYVVADRTPESFLFKTGVGFPTHSFRILQIMKEQLTHHVYRNLRFVGYAVVEIEVLEHEGGKLIENGFHIRIEINDTL